jgi:hypothetical protein
MRFEELLGSLNMDREPKIIENIIIIGIEAIKYNR